jgi:hypothetical protein
MRFFSMNYFGPIIRDALSVFLVGYLIATTQYMSYGNFPALLVEEHFEWPSVHYFRQNEDLSRTTDVP